MRALVTVALAGLLLAGCATTANYEAKLNTWVGSNADMLVESWGPPDRSYALSDGSKVLEYDRSRMVSIGGFAYTTPQTSYTYGNINSMGGGMASYSGYTTSYVQRQTPVENVAMSCSTRFTVNPQNIIVRWAYQGNDCRSR